MNTNQHRITAGLSRKKRYKVEWLFDQLQLPIPTAKQSYKANTAVTFINQAGCTIRINRKSKNPLIRDRHILRPFFSYTLSPELRLDISQGGNIKKECLEEVFRMHKHFNTQSIKVDDAGTSNTCFLPITTDDYEEGFPEVFDPDGVYSINGKSYNSITAKLAPNIADLRPQSTTDIDEQDIHYGDYRDIMAEAWLHNPKKPNQSLVELFWRMCVNAKNEGEFICGWLNTTTEKQPNGFRNVALSSENYAQSLAEHNPSIFG